MKLSFLSMRRFADGGTMVAQRGSLLGYTAIDQSEVDLARPVPPLLSAERAVNHDVLFGEGFNASGDGTSTPLAGDDEDHAGAGERLRGVPGSHGRSLRRRSCRVIRRSCGRRPERKGLWLRRING